MMGRGGGRRRRRRRLKIVPREEGLVKTTSSY